VIFDLDLIEWGSIYFQLGKGGGVFPHMKEVELGVAGLLELVPVRRHVEHQDPWGGWGRRAGRNIGP
jgi:hypothetical protein